MFNTYLLIALQLLLPLDDVFIYYQFNSMPLFTFIHLMSTLKILSNKTIKIKPLIKAAFFVSRFFVH